jgi:hypothetical protein
MSGIGRLRVRGGWCSCLEEVVWLGVCGIPSVWSPDVRSIDCGFVILSL